MTEVVVLRNLRKPVAAANESLFRRKPASTRARIARAARLVFEPLEPRLLLDGTTPVISELMAVNNSGLTDGDGDCSDWIDSRQGKKIPGQLCGQFSDILFELLANRRNGFYLVDQRSDADAGSFQAPLHAC